MTGSLSFFRNSPAVGSSSHRKPPRFSPSSNQRQGKDQLGSTTQERRSRKVNDHDDDDSDSAERPFLSALSTNLFEANLSSTPDLALSSTMDTSDGVARGTKSCLPGNLFFQTWRWNRRHSKISSTDVASVGNASDTLIPISEFDSSLQHSREFHESAKLYWNHEDYPRALDCFEAILMAQVSRFGPMHPSVGAAMHNVGVCRQRMHQQQLAENLLSEAVAIRQHTLGHDHLDVAASLSKLGAARAALKKYEESFSDLRQAICITQNHLGYENKTVAQMLCHLACFYFEAGEFFAAEATFMDSYRIYQKVWTTATTSIDRDSCMAQMTETLCNVGSIQNKRKRFNDAIATFSDALDLQLGIYDPAHPRIVSTLDNLAFSYTKNKEYATALSCYQKMLKAQITHSGTFTTDCFETFRKQILMYEKLKKFDDAVKTAQSTLRLQESMLPDDHKIINDTKGIIAGLVRRCNLR